MKEKVAPVTGKRKREADPQPLRRNSIIQLIAGSYDRALHGILATIDTTPEPLPATSSVTFTNNFLINAHASSVRCLALSPASDATPDRPSSRMLASGGADEKINLYQLTASQPSRLSAKAVHEHPQNRELGSLLHHSSTITTLSFPSRGKLLSGALDNKIAISRVRDWTVLSEIKAPFPKIQGRPSGDTAAPGEAPAGINDVAVHPSARLCLSVGQGEKSMRLWNLVTGKKAGVLTFEKSVLTALGEGRWRGGEAHTVVWSDDGNEFAVGFEHGAVVYDLACAIRGVAKVQGTKVCKVKYVLGSPSQQITRAGASGDEDKASSSPQLLALSTEDGRILFYNTSPITELPRSSAMAMEGGIQKLTKAEQVPVCGCVGQLGEKSRGGRIKDFALLPTEQDDEGLLIATASSTGVVKLWSVSNASLGSLISQDTTMSASASAISDKDSLKEPQQIGVLLGTTETGRRITCLEAFIMSPAMEVGATNGINGKGK